MMTTGWRAFRGRVAQQSAVRGREVRRMLKLQRMPRLSLVVEALRAVGAAVGSRLAPLALGSTLDTGGPSAGAQKVHPMRRSLSVFARSGTRVL
ncbi:hypothetical protein WN51_09379 [Melipona quadrifasciata]|uniref:Uncharacterized protein n=1 Tax=Melipona quadrifasciata TaxID=166423 RepID=A0A0N0BIN5_9HYME|nr:hypothetical protein WN51_09379 [Melipona quadrifasciata]